MKKFTTIITLLLLMFTLASCNQVSQFIDETEPEILGAEDITISVGDSFNVLTGVTANDDTDGDITAEITYTITDDIGNVVMLDINVEGDYYVNYRVEDDGGNVAVVIRKVTVTAALEINNPPVIVVEGDLMLLQGVAFNPLQGVTASDPEDGNVTPLITFEIKLDGVVISDYSDLAVGVYQVIYSVEDTEGLSDAVTRMVTVTAVVSDVVVHVHLDTETEAQQRLQEFFDDVLDGVLSIPEICSKYIGDVPFPINDSTYDDCVVGLGEITPQLIDVVVGEVVETEHEGNPIYTAAVTVTGIDFSVSAPLDFAFLSLDGASESYLHFYGNPFLFDNGDGDIETATAFLEYFYDNFFDTNYDTGTFCSDLLIPMSPNGLLYDDCVSELDTIRSNYNSYFVYDVHKIGEMTLPDQSVGDVYSAYVSVNTTEGVIDVYIEIAVFEYEGNTTFLVVSDPLSGYGFNPDDLTLFDVSIEDATALISAFYFDIYEMSLSSNEVCTNYLDGLPFGPSLIECTEVVDFMRNETQDLQVTFVSETTIDIEGDLSLNGYVATIEFYYGAEIEPNIEDIRFLVLEYEGSPKLFLTDHPLGIDSEEVQGYVTVPLDEVLSESEMLYQNLYDTNYIPLDFCEIYMSVVLGDLPDYNVCERDIGYFRHFTQSYSLGTITEINIPHDGGQIVGYNVEVQFINIFDEVFDNSVMIGFYQGDMGIELHLFNYPVVYLGSEYNTAYLFDTEAEAELLELYNLMLDPLEDVNTLCSNYIANDPNGPSLEECIGAVEQMRVDFNSVVIDDIVDSPVMTEFEILNGFTAQITLDGPAGPHSFALEFIVVHDDTELDVVLFGHPAGMDGPGLTLVDLSIEDALVELQNFYTSILDTDISETAFCEGYFLYFPMETNVADCEVDIANIRATIFGASVISVIQIDINNEGMVGVGYSAQVDLVDGDAVTHTITLEYIFIDTEVGAKILVMGNPGLEQPTMDYNFVDLDVVSAEVKFVEMYDNIFNTALSSSDLCNAYTYGDPYGPSHDECMQAVDEIRANFETYSCSAILEVVIDWNGADVNGFVTTLALESVNGDRVFDLYFTFADPHYLGHYNLIFYGSPGGDMGPSFADMNLIDATNWINQYYLAVVDDNISDPLFCEVYLALFDDMNVMDAAACETVRTEFTSGAYVFAVDSVEEFAAIDGNPPYFTATITRTVGEDTLIYSVSFLFLIDENDQIVLAVQFERSLGMLEVIS